MRRCRTRPLLGIGMSSEEAFGLSLCVNLVVLSYLLLVHIVLLQLRYGSPRIRPSSSPTFDAVAHRKSGSLGSD